MYNEFLMKKHFASRFDYINRVKLVFIDPNRTLLATLSAIIQCHR